MWLWCVVSCAPLVVVSTGGICAGFRTCQICRRSALVLLWCAPCLLPALLHCACRVACKYGSISRFKGFLARFGVLVWVCMGLVLCLDCVAFVRVRCLAVRE